MVRCRIFYHHAKSKQHWDSREVEGIFHFFAAWFVYCKSCYGRKCSCHAVDQSDGIYMYNAYCPVARYGKVNRPYPHVGHFPVLVGRKCLPFSACVLPQHWTMMCKIIQKYTNKICRDIKLSTSAIHPYARLSGCQTSLDTRPLPLQRSASVLWDEHVSLHQKELNTVSLHEGVTFSIHFLIYTGSSCHAMMTYVPRASALRERQTYVHSW